MLKNLQKMLLFQIWDKMSIAWNQLCFPDPDGPITAINSLVDVSIISFISLDFVARTKLNVSNNENQTDVSSQLICVQENL